MKGEPGLVVADNLVDELSHLEWETFEVLDLVDLSHDVAATSSSSCSCSSTCSCSTSSCCGTTSSSCSSTSSCS
jgi:hypothetical protein